MKRRKAFDVWDRNQRIAAKYRRGYKKKQRVRDRLEARQLEREIE